MKLLYPDFLWALLAVFVPIIIHLFNFKKFKREYFSNINLLKEVKLETQSKSKLKHLLVLFSRIIAISLLVLAFCQPYIETSSSKKASDNIVGIYIDNSQSMDVKSSDGYLLDLAKKTAFDIVNVYSASDEFQLLTNDFEGKHQRIVSQEEVLKLIEEVSLSPISRTFEEVYEREVDLLKKNEGEKQLFWLSDFQKNNLTLSNLQIDSMFTLKMMPFAQEELSNVYIDSVWFSSPLRQVNKDEKLNVRIINKSNNDIGTKVNLKVNNEVKGILNTTISANSEKNVQLNYSIQKRGEQLGEVYISDYPDPNLIFDDKFLFSYTIDKKSKILLISNKNETNETSNIRAVYSDNDNYIIENEYFSNIDYSRLSNYSLLILEDVKEVSSGLKNEVLEYLKRGGSILLIPSENIDQNSYNELFNSSISGSINNSSKNKGRVGSLNRDNVFYENVFEKMPVNLDLPQVSSYYPIDFRTKSQTNILMSLENNDSFLSASKVGKGIFYFLSSPLTQNTFSEHALFVPTLLKVAENSQLSYPLYYEIGEKGLVTINNNIKDEVVSIKEVNSSFEFIPEVIKNKNDNAVLVHEKIKNSSHYQLFSSGKNILPMTYNLSRSESELDYYNISELTNEIEKNQLNSYIKVVETATEGKANSIGVLIDNQKYWKYFVIGGLIFLLIEILLIKFFKS